MAMETPWYDVETPWYDVETPWYDVETPWYEPATCPGSLLAAWYNIYPLVNDHIAGWNITIFNRKYIFNPGPFSIAMLDYRSVASFHCAMSYLRLSSNHVLIRCMQLLPCFFLLSPKHLRHVDVSIAQAPPPQHDSLVYKFVSRSGIRATKFYDQLLAKPNNKNNCRHQKVIVNYVISSGWWLSHPSEQNARQTGSFLQGSR